jgi:hypothetical protein
VLIVAPDVFATVAVNTTDRP